MTGNRQSRTWVWLAVAAMAAVSLAPAKTGITAAKVLPNPVLAFLSGHSVNPDPSATGSPGVRAYAGSRQFRVSAKTSGTSLWLAVVPILFIGLIAPLSLLPTLSAGWLGRSPALEPLFQRPPPFLPY